MKAILAHGFLGPFDELIYLSPMVIFILTACFTWLRTFNMRQDKPPRPDDNATYQKRSDMTDDESVESD